MVILKGNWRVINQVNASKGLKHENTVIGYNIVSQKSNKHIFVLFCQVSFCTVSFPVGHPEFSLPRFLTFCVQCHALWTVSRR